MALPFKFNFRSQAADGTDNAGETYVVSNPQSPGGNMEAYSVVRDSITFGWVTPGGGGTRTRTHTDVRFLGCHFNEVNTTESFRVDLPSTGSYTIRIAAGDAANAQTVKVELFDNTTSLGVLCNGTTSAPDRFFDAVGAEYSGANWPANNTAVTKTFATTTFIVKIGNGSASATGWIAHLEIAAAAAATTTKPLWPMSYF